jgi:hypothetical protein
MIDAELDRRTTVLFPATAIGRELESFPELITEPY